MKQPDDRSRRGFLKASSMLGLAVAFSPAAIGEAFAGSKSKTNPKEDAMTQTSAAQQRSDDAIRPFQMNFPEADLTDLRRRINATRWPDKETVTDASQGVQMATMQKLARYWGTDYDWSKCQAKLDATPQFMTNIDGLDIHFIHTKSKNANALPVIITHGWPGSIIEQMKIIDPLTDPDGARGNGSGFFRRGDPFAAGLRIFRQADCDRMGSTARRTRLGGPDDALGIRTIYGSGRRLGKCSHGADGSADTFGIDRDSHQHAGHCAK